MLIIFDLDDTLIETSKCITPTYLKRAYDAMCKKGLIAIDFSELIKINEKAISSKAAIKTFWEKTDAKEESLQAGLKSMHLPLSQDLELESTEGALELLNDLKGIDICLVTMGDPALQFSKMKKAGIQPEQFSKLVIGKGLSKKFHYQAILEELKPEKCIVCGDRVSVDLTPAKELGLTTVHFRNGRGKVHDFPKEDVDYTIEKIKDIKNIL